MIEVGTLFPFANDRLLVRLIVSPPVAPVGTVITTGDQVCVVTGGVPDVVTDKGFNAAHVAVEVATAAPQV
jgi:hypothetical protein